MKVEKGQTDNHKVMGKTIDGLRGYLYLLHTTVNTAFVAGDLNRNDITIKAVLMRDGARHDIVNDGLQNLAAFSMFSRGGFPMWNASGAFISYRDQTAAIKQLAHVPFVIDFGGHINLKGDDYIMLEVRVNNSAFGANVDAAGSYLYMEERESVGVEVATPSIRAVTIQAAQTIVNHDLGNAIDKILFLNLDKDGYKEDTQVVSSASINSDKYKLDAGWHELFAQRVDEYDINYLDGKQSFLLFNEGVNLNNVSVRMNLVGENVVASKNYLMYRSWTFNPRIVKRGLLANEEHKFEEAAQAGMQIDANQYAQVKKEKQSVS